MGMRVNEVQRNPKAQIAKMGGRARKFYRESAVANTRKEHIESSFLWAYHSGERWFDRQSQIFEYRNGYALPGAHSDWLVPF